MACKRWSVRIRYSPQPIFNAPDRGHFYFQKALKIYFNKRLENKNDSAKRGINNMLLGPPQRISEANIINIDLLKS